MGRGAIGNMAPRGALRGRWVVRFLVRAPWITYGLAIKNVTSPATCGVDCAWVGPNTWLAVVMNVCRSV